jgi:hypothetical protein
MRAEPDRVGTAQAWALAHWALVSLLAEQLAERFCFARLAVAEVPAGFPGFRCTRHEWQVAPPVRAQQCIWVSTCRQSPFEAKFRRRMRSEIALHLRLQDSAAGGILNRSGFEIKKLSDEYRDQSPP